MLRLVSQFQTISRLRSFYWPRGHEWKSVSLICFTSAARLTSLWRGVKLKPKQCVCATISVGESLYQCCLSAARTASRPARRQPAPVRALLPVIRGSNIWINKPPATKWSFYCRLPMPAPRSGGPLSTGSERHEVKPLTAQGAAGQTTRKWAVCLKRFSTLSNSPLILRLSVDLHRHRKMCRSRWLPRLWRLSRLLSTLTSSCVHYQTHRSN